MGGCLTELAKIYPATIRFSQIIYIHKYRLLEHCWAFREWAIRGKRRCCWSWGGGAQRWAGPRCLAPLPSEQTTFDQGWTYLSIMRVNTWSCWRLYSSTSIRLPNFWPSFSATLRMVLVMGDMVMQMMVLIMVEEDDNDSSATLRVMMTMTMIGYTQS